MASPGGASANDDLRGRSNLPKRGEITYSSLRLRVPSQERPLHISPDRITRHASPGRANRLADEQEVVPRIPQPYRTSFSAVTSPRRVPRPANLAPLDRACPFRSTMPGRITSPPERKPNYTFQSYDHRRGASKYSLDSRNAGASGTKAGQNHKTNGAKLASQSAENVLNGANEEAKMSVPPGYSEPDLNINKSLVNGDESVRAFMSNGTIQTQQTDESDVISNTLESTDFTDGGTSPEPQMFTFEVEAKKLITREYVHVNDISYFKALDKKAKLPTPNEETERIVANMMRGKKREWQLMSPRTHREQHAGMSLPTSPDESPKLRPQRSGTLPSESLLAGKPMASTPVKRSLSTSITNFFRRMSPKSLRRSSKGSQKSKTTATPDSSTNSLQAVFCDSADDLSQDSDHSGAHNKGKGKSPKSPKASPIRNLLSQSFRKSKEKISHTNPTSASSSKEANLSKEALSPSPLPGGPDDNPSPSNSPQVLSTDSARILKSIENNSQVVCEKNVYHAFKEKQSPKRMNEAMSMKPQALKAVEFPDQYLNVSDKITQSDTSIDNVDNNAQSVPSHLDTTDNANIRINEELTKVASLPGTLDRHSKKKEPISSASGMLLLPKGDAQGGVIRRANDPPKTLDVREVAKLQKAVFMFPNMSAESIGQCSVNLYTSGQSTRHPFHLFNGNPL